MSRIAARGRRRAVFVDKDGTLVDDVPYNVDPSRVSFTPHAMQGLRMLMQQGYLIVIVTNQPGVAMRLFDLAALQRLQHAIVGQLAEHGVQLAGFHACPHGRDEGCRCRKPAPGLLQNAAASLGIDLSASWMVGDILDDIEAGRRAGCRTVLLDVGNETEWQLSPWRTPYHRAANLRDAANAILASDLEHAA